MITSLKNYALDAMKKPQIRSILIVSFFLYFSKGLGFIRQILILDRMSPLSSDLLLSGLQIPNLITSFLISGTIITSVLPVAARLYGKQKNTDSMVQYLEIMWFFIFLVIGGLCTLCIIFIEQFTPIFVSSASRELFMQNGTISDLYTVSRILLLGPIIFSAQGIIGIFLNIKNRFFVFSLAGLVSNIGAIIGIGAFGRDNYISAAIGMMCGALAGSILYIIEAYRNGWRVKPQFIFSFAKHIVAYRQDILKTWNMFWPRIFVINGTIMANFLIVRLQSSSGQITALDFALSIEEIFLTLIVSISSVFFPDIAQKIHDNVSLTEIKRKLLVYAKSVGFLSSMGAVTTIIATPLLIYVLSLITKGQGGQQYQYITVMAQLATIALPFQSVVEVLSKYFHAKERTWQPVGMSFVATVVQISLSLSLSQFMDAGIAVIIALICNFATILCGYWYFLRKDFSEQVEV